MTTTTAPVVTRQATRSAARSSSRTKVLAPLVVLIAAGAVTLQSGAVFTSQSSNAPSAVTSGTLSQANSKADEAIFSADGIAPGGVVDGSLTLTNTGSLPADFGLTEVVSTNEFAEDVLSLTVADVTDGSQATERRIVYSGTFGGLVDGDRTALGTFAPGEARTYEFALPVVRADAGKLYAVLLNLVSNALKFGGEDHPPQVDLGAERLDDRWRITVADRGPGVPDEDRDRIFGLFERGLDPLAVPGRGIGLSVVRRVIADHGGQVGVDDRPGGGSVFWVELPDERR